MEQDQFIKLPDDMPEFTNINEQLNWLTKMIFQIRQDQLRYYSNLECKTYTIADLADWLGCSESKLRCSRWMLPNFGKPNIGQHPGRWRNKTVMNWYAEPESDQKTRWEAMNSIQWRRAMGLPRRPGRRRRGKE
jgi:hypothetical protein